MRELVTLVVLLVFAPEAAAQDPSLRRDAGGSRYFGAPVAKWTVIGDQGALMFGGRGGWSVSSSLSLGGGLYGTVTEIDAPESAAPDSLGALDIAFESFGFELEYAARPAASTHLTLDASFGGAAAHLVRDGTREQEGETDFMIFLEPGVGLERRLADWLHVNFAMSYRLVSGVELARLDNGDLRGAAATVAVKLGRFYSPRLANLTILD